jgi:hypothetical protein
MYDPIESSLKGFKLPNIDDVYIPQRKQFITNILKQTTGRKKPRRENVPSPFGHKFHPQKSKFSTLCD